MYKILFFSIDSDPFKDISYGGRQRTHLLLRALSKVAQVDVCSFVNCVTSNIDGCKVVFSESKEKTKRLYQSPFSRILSMVAKSPERQVYRANGPMSKIANSLIEMNDYDYIVVRYLQSVPQLGLSKYVDRLIVDFDDNPVKSYVMSEKIKGGIHSVLPKLRSLPVRRAWKSVQKRCIISFYSNPSETKYPNSFTLHNIPVRFCLNLEQPIQRSLLFVGALNYLPNRNGITRFLSNVWPELHRKFPDLTFRIVGKCTDGRLVEKWNGCEGVHYLGYVDDLETQYRKCTVVVAPVYYGAGTSIKVLEAVAMGRPCVTTPTGFCGLEDILVPNEGIRIARNDRDFLKQISFLLESPEEAASFTAKSQECVLANLSESTFMAQVKESLELVFV